MASNGWEYVGKKKSGRTQKKKVPEASDASESEGRIKLSETTFQAFNELENRKTKQKTVINNKSNGDYNHENDVNEKKAAKNKPKKKTISPSDSPKTQTSLKPLTFEQIAKQLKVSEFEKVSEETKVKFPDMPLIWLKDIAYFLNGKFPSVEPEDVTFADKSIDYPSSALPTNVLDFIKRNIKQCPQPILQLIQEQLLQNLVLNLGKMNGPTLGFRIMLQCIGTQFPEFTLKNVQKFIQQRNSYSNRQQVCLTILWVASQSGKTHLKTGINIWLELMFPLISQKAYTKFVIDSLRTLLELHANTKLSGDVIEVKHFFVLLDFINSPANGLQTASQKQLDVLYPKLKLISIGSNRHMSSRLYFPHLFDRLDSELYVNRKVELLSELTNCLSSDTQCFSVWRSLYSQNLVKSSQLLAYLNDNYHSLPSTLSKKLLRETVLSFRNTNDDTRNQDRVLKEGHEACESQCEVLLHTMSSWKFPIKSLVFGLTVILAALLAYDTKSHQSFQRTLLKRTGTLPVVEQAYNKVETYSLMSYSWLSVNLPVYWNSVSAVLSPYVNLFWQKFTETMVYLWNSTEVFRNWINKNIPPLLEKITDEYMPKVTSVVLQMSTKMQIYLSVLWAFVVNNSLLVVNWIQTNVLTGSLAPENIQKVMIQAVSVLQTYVLDAYQWTTTHFKALVNQ